MQATTDFVFSSQLQASFHAGLKAFWARWLPSPRPCFNSDLLDTLKRYTDFLDQSKGRLITRLGELPIEYAVMTLRFAMLVSQSTAPQHPDPFDPPRAKL